MSDIEEARTSDSDDEYIQRRRDKFRGERSKAKSENKRPEKFIYSRKERSDYSRSRWDRPNLGPNRSYSPNFEQSSKRPKYYNYEKNWQNNRPRPVVRPRQSSMMSFKTFIVTQDDGISDIDAIANYNEYKLKFEFHKMEKFFKSHKNEEWFRIKYHPEDSMKYKEEQSNALKRRIDVFLELLNANKIDCINVDSSKTKQLLKFLDTVALKLEGGTEKDFAALEKEYSELDEEKFEVKETLPSKSEMTQKKLPRQEGKIEKEGDEKIEKPSEVKTEKHKTSSIYLCNLSSTITRKEIESICSKYDGFLRVWLSDPEPENNWICRGWVTFRRDANVQEVCSILNTHHIKDCKLNAIVINKDISNRICLVNGITADKQVVKSDIRMSAKIVLHLDKLAGLWLNDDGEKEKTDETFGFLPKNPVLHNISEYLIEEELLGLKQNLENTTETNLDRDDNLIAVLDKIILYLRVVHSVDYYNNCKYPKEDEMPNRCGILHVRGPPPSNISEISQFVGKKVEAKLAQFLPEKVNKTEEENQRKLVNLAIKDFDVEVDKFVLENTKELGRDKWQCPLSGKKFKGPDFVRKHIFLKYSTKIEEVKKDVEFFNNYVRDPKRLVLNTTHPENEESGNPSRFCHNGFLLNSRSRPTHQVVGEKRNSRVLIRYEDLDAPSGMYDEMF